MSITPVRNTQTRKRKHTGTSQFLSMKNFRDSKSIIRKRKVKLRQITFKKPGNLKYNRIKNSSEISTASQKASKELIFRSFISSDSKKTKKSRNKSRMKQRGTIKIKNNLGIIQEEKNRKNKRNKMVNYNSNNHKFIKKLRVKDSFLTVENPNGKRLRRPTVCSVISDDESIKKNQIFSDRLPTSSHKISSRSGQKQSNERGSENRRYGSSYSFDTSTSNSNKSQGT